MDLSLSPPKYEGEDIQIIEDKPFEWQTQILELIKQKPDKRKVYWFFDPLGGSGKTTFAKYLTYHGKALTLGWGRTQDLMLARKINEDRNIIIFNFNRSKPHDVQYNDIFSAIESLKDGLGFSAKYESQAFITAQPHILCFSNQLPNPESLSKDRWEIYAIGNGKMRLLTIQQINGFIKLEWEKELLEQTDLYLKNYPNDPELKHFKFEHKKYTSLWIEPNQLHNEDLQIYLDSIMKDN